MSFSTIRSALPYIIPTILDRALTHGAPILAKEINRFAESKGIGYRILTSATENRRKWAKRRWEESYYTPEELGELIRHRFAKKQARAGGGHFQQRPNAPPQFVPHPDLEAQAGYNVRVGPNQFMTDPSLRGKQIYGVFRNRPITNPEEWEGILRRATQRRGQQYHHNNGPVPGPPPSTVPAPMDEVAGDFHPMEPEEPAPPVGLAEEHFPEELEDPAAVEPPPVIGIPSLQYMHNTPLTVEEEESEPEPNMPLTIEEEESEVEEKKEKKKKKKKKKNSMEVEVKGDKPSEWALRKRAETPEERRARFQRELAENLRNFESKGFESVKKGSNRVSDVVTLFTHGKTNPKEHIQKRTQRAAQRLFSG